MVIICPECSTKFRIDPERIPDRGAKVRCARCKHVFLQQRPVDQQPVPDPAEENNMSAFSSDEPDNASSSLRDQSSTAFDQFSQSEDDFATQTAESGFNYEQFRALDQTPQEEDTFGFSDDLATAEEMPDDSFTFVNEPEEGAESSDRIEPIAGAGKDLSEKVAQKPTVQNLESETEAEVPEPPKVRAEPDKSTPLGGVVRVLFLLILGLLILGGVLYFVNGPEQFEQTIQQLFGQTESRTAPSGQIILKNLEGKFIKNDEAGELFIIRGEAINQFREPRASIQVKGVIFDHSGKSLLQKTIFCGNPISDQELQTLPFSKIEELMSNQFGKSLSNMNVNAEQTISFTIVFRDLPKSLAEFSVNIASSKPATQ